MAKKTTDTIAISVKGVKKDFVLPHEKNTSIKSGIVNVFRKKTTTKEMQHALRGIDFDIKEGEFFGILGRNGSGKSTLLKILAEIYQPTKGSVNVTGKLVPFIELGVGFNPELTGRENVYLNGALLGFSRKEIDERYDDIVEFAELEKFMDQKLKNYSSGMQVRLAFSVATRAEADILLVDEVLAVGDADFQRKCYDFFKSLKKSGKTVVFVTHDMGAVREYCDRAVLINEGKITHSGEAGAVADEYLKLFNQSIDGSESTDPKRWGTGHVKSSGLKAKIVDDEIHISTKLTATKKTMDDVVVGIRLTDAEGIVIAGGSTLNASEGATKAITVEKGSPVPLTFTFKNILGSGSYLVSVTVRSADGTVYDSIDDSAKISVSKDDTYYPIVLPSTVTIDQK